MKEVRSYALVLKYGEPQDRVIRGITPEGGKAIIEDLKKDPPKFIEVKGKLVATDTIQQIAPVY